MREGAKARVGDFSLGVALVGGVVGLEDEGKVVVAPEVQDGERVGRGVGSWGEEGGESMGHGKGFRDKEEAN